jgi:hypothetical protein
MALTKEQVLNYLASPWVCPGCGAKGENLIPSGIDGFNAEELDGTELMVRITCGKCGKSWRNYYLLHDVEEEDEDGCAIPNEGENRVVNTYEDLLQVENTYKDLVAAYDQVEAAFLDALHALNDEGLPCPASLGLAMEKLKQIIAKAKLEKEDALPG